MRQDHAEAVSAGTATLAAVWWLFYLFHLGPQWFNSASGALDTVWWAVPYYVSACLSALALWMFLVWGVYRLLKPQDLATPASRQALASRESEACTRRAP